MTMPLSLSTFRQVYPLRVCRPVVMIALCLSVCAVLFSMFTNKAAWGYDKVNAEVPETKTCCDQRFRAACAAVCLAEIKCGQYACRPGHEYPLQWVYVRKNLPLKVISEFDVWRKVVDHEGVTGWVHGQLVSLKRFGVVTSSNAKLRAEPNEQAAVTAVAEAGVLMEVQYCEGAWCRLATQISPEAGWNGPGSGGFTRRNTELAG